MFLISTPARRFFSLSSYPAVKVIGSIFIFFYALHFRGCKLHAEGSYRSSPAAANTHRTFIVHTVCARFFVQARSRHGRRGSRPRLCMKYGTTPLQCLQTRHLSLQKKSWKKCSRQQYLKVNRVCSWFGFIVSEMWPDVTYGPNCNPSCSVALNFQQVKGKHTAFVRFYMDFLRI